MKYPLLCLHSGFGEMASRRFASMGFKVVSACLTKDGADKLNGKVLAYIHINKPIF